MLEYFLIMVFRLKGREEELLRVPLTTIFYRTKKGQLKSKWYEFVEVFDVSKVESKFDPKLPVKVAIYVR